MGTRNYARLPLPVRASARAIYDAFVEPEQFVRFWLAKSSAPLEVGVPVRWDFMVPGASETTTAAKLVRGELIRFAWSDGVKVAITIERRSRTQSVVRIVAGPFRSTNRAVDAAEGFSIVLCDLKVLLESGRSPGLVRAKARLIAR